MTFLALLPMLACGRGPVVTVSTAPSSSISFTTLGSTESPDGDLPAEPDFIKCEAFGGMVLAAQDRDVALPDELVEEGTCTVDGESRTFRIEMN